MEPTSETLTEIQGNDPSLEDTLDNRYLTFSVGKEIYGIEIRYVTEIVVMQPITQIPDMPDVIKGVINLRGTVISVMDMRTRFCLEESGYDDRTCIVVIEAQGLLVGFIVDGVKEVLNIPDKDIDPPPKTHSGIQSNYIQGLGKVDGDVKILLNVENILYEDELAQLH